MRRCVVAVIVVVHSLASVASLVPKVLYESDRILAIEKPPGISHHNDEETGEKGIVSLLRTSYNEDAGGGGRLYGVHRLDRVTSGILLFAKDPDMAGILSKAFRNNQVVKYYFGISNRKPKKKKQGWVKGCMGRGRRKSWFFTRQKQESSTTEDKRNYAVTRFFTAGLGGLDVHCKTEDKIGGDTTNHNHKPATCLLFRPHTGKTHQLRVAAKSVGLPLIGDPIYGDGGGASACRTMLHAAAIHIPMAAFSGGENKSVTIWSPPPFAELLWDENANDSYGQVLDNLLEKHCECSDILCEKQRCNEGKGQGR